MKGQEHLIAMRLRRVVPVMVYIDIDPSGAIDQSLNAEDPTRARIWIEEGDFVPSLDLRCLHGLQVSVSGSSGERVRAVCDAAKGVGARRVIGAVVSHLGSGEFARCEMVTFTDTQDDYEWSAHGERVY